MYNQETYPLKKVAVVQDIDVFEGLLSKPEKEEKKVLLFFLENAKSNILDYKQCFSMQPDIYIYANPIKSDKAIDVINKENLNFSKNRVSSHFILSHQQYLDMIQKSPNSERGELKLLAEHFIDGLLVLNKEGMIHYANPVAREMFGETVVNIDSYFGFPLADDGDVEITLLQPNAENRIIEMRTNPIVWKGENVILTSLRDITEQKRLEEELEKLARKDGLTGLYNHRTFYEMLEDGIIWSKRKKKPLSLLILDIDHFKFINDTYGHQVGDTVLKELSALLVDQVRETDRVCRYGGEEITIILHETDKEVVREISERICKFIEAYHFDIGDDKYISMTVSIGYSVYPKDATTAKELVSTADRAMYDAKNNGRNQAIRFKNEMVNESANS